MNKEIKILVACHKEDPQIRNGGIYFPIQVGKDLHPDIDLGFQCDNTGDNISAKNGSYCELTALYWAWKNLKNVDIIGLAHYRRYFSEECLNKYSEKIADSKVIIVAVPNITPFNLYTQYSICHNSRDLVLLDKVVEKHFPEYYPAFKEAIYRTNRLSPYNMFISSWKIFDDYCIWLFKVLNIVERELNIDNYNTYQARIIGFLAERLFNVYLSYLAKNRHVLIKYEDLDSENHNLGTNMKNYMGRIKNTLIFHLNKNYTKCRITVEDCLV